MRQDVRDTIFRASMRRESYGCAAAKELRVYSLRPHWPDLFCGPQIPKLKRCPTCVNSESSTVQDVA